MRKNKLFLLLALLLTAATGAWADETLLVTIENTGDNASFNSGSKTFDDKVTVTFSNEVINYDVYGWYATSPASLLTVAGTNGYTITSCKFYVASGDAATGYTIKGESPSVYLFGGYVFTDDSKSVNIGMPGVTKIEVYGYEGTAPAAAGYSVKMKADVKDAKNWSIASGEKSAKGDAADGLTGLKEKDAVTLTYTGRLKVKGVKATSDAGAAAVPDGAIGGKFSVSDSKQVYFSKGNLRYASSKWSFFDNQWDYYSSYSADAWDHFGWSTSATTYGMSTSQDNATYPGDFVDWGATMGTGWFTLSSDEWTYLLNTRSASTVGGTENGRYAKAKVNNVGGIILFPDTYTHPDGVAAPTGVNATDETGWNGNSYTVADWTKMESAGCVFLPSANRRDVTSVNVGTNGYYWSSSPYDTNRVYSVSFGSGSLNPAGKYNRNYGHSVRLVREVAASDAGAAKEPATVTTAPTGAAIVGVGKTTALVSGGVAEGGTLMYRVTTENTKPASTDGFSDKVPTAENITASGKVYVWYYVKGDDTHSDSEIAATAIEVPVADIVWDATNVSDLMLFGPNEYEKEGITLSANGEQVDAMWFDYGNPEWDGLSFTTHASGGYTFTAPTGKAFTKIEMKPKGPAGWSEAGENEKLGTGWVYDRAYNYDNNTEIITVTWKGSAATSSVNLLTDVDDFPGETTYYIAFYLSK